MHSTINQVFNRIQKGFNIHKEDITLNSNGSIEVLITDHEDIVNCWLNITPYNKDINVNNIGEAIVSECDVEVCNYSSTTYFSSAHKENVKVSCINDIVEAVKNNAEYQYVSGL